MADKYLNPEQEAQLAGMLNQQTAPEENAPQGEAAPAEAAGAPAPEQQPQVDAGAQANGQGVDPVAQALSEMGITSIEELVARYKDRESKAAEYKDMLAQLLAYQQALENEETLDSTDPLNSVKEAVREEIKPLYEKLQADARNKVVQEAWNKDAREMPDIAEVMPEIAQFITEHPNLAVSDDGLRRAYDSVRSRKYRTEAQMLEDDEFVKRMASNEKVKQAVLQSHLSEIARTGDNVPNSIGSGGNVPLTGQKRAPDSMSQAKSGLAAMLGLKK